MSQFTLNKHDSYENPFGGVQRKLANFGDWEDQQFSSANLGVSLNSSPDLLALDIQWQDAPTNFM